MLVITADALGRPLQRLTLKSRQPVERRLQLGLRQPQPRSLVEFAASQERLCKEFDTVEGRRRQEAGILIQTERPQKLHSWHDRDRKSVV